jgi:hypothetical protein
MPSLASRKNRDAAAMVTRYSDGPKPGVLEALVFGFQGKPIDKQSRLTLSAPARARDGSTSDPRL